MRPVRFGGLVLPMMALVFGCNDDTGDSRPPFLGPQQDLGVTCTATPSSGRAPLTVRLNAEPADAQSVQWTFGDGSGEGRASVSHTYEIGGTFAPTVTIRNSGHEGVCRTSVTVDPPPPPPSATARPNQLPRPLTKFEPTSSGPAPLTITINACPSYDLDGEPLTFRIDPGDRTPQETRCRPVHTYERRGTYRPTVCVSDGKVEVCHAYTVTVT